METEQNEEIQTALFDVQRYLLDQIPPLTASDAVETLMTQPAELLMKLIHGWSVEQARHQAASQSDFFYHALRKIYLISALKLIDRVMLEKYLERVIPLVMQACPSEEREILRSSLNGLRESLTVGGGMVGSMTQQAQITKLGVRDAPAPTVAGAVSDVVTRSARRLSLVVERLAKHLPFAGGAATASPQTQAAIQESAPKPSAELVSMAAASASTEEELKAYVRKLGAYTGETDTEKLLHVLAVSMPNWDVAIPATAKQPAAIEAMHKIITLTPTTESAKRFRELTTEAVEQFNNGSLAAAVSMLELAARVIVEKKLDATVVERVRGDVVERISSERLKKYAENKAKHPLLRRALGFFPTLTKESLFQELRGEQRPERRRALLSLLEAYGSEARTAALGELAAELSRPSAEMDTYFLRNVIYLLHRISSDSDVNAAQELELLTRASARGQNIYVVKESVIPLGHLKNEGAARVLTTRMAEFEVMLLRKDISQYPMDEMQKVLDRIASALGRIATPAALLTLARHAMKPNPLLGDTRGRLAPLSQHDLSFDEQTVDLLVGAIRTDLPTRILGRVITTQKQPPVRLIEALANTRSEKVETLLSEIAEKFADHEVGRAAAAALFNLNAAKPEAATRQTAGASLTGDLDFFGLPSLMQSLGDQQATGIVTFSSRGSGQTSGKLLFVEGKFAEAQTAHLRGAEALYQLLERPLSGTFAFVPQPPANVKTRNEPQDIMPLLFEGIRRHDELRQLVLFVPDDLSLRSTTTKPTPDQEESDPTIIRDVWVKASSGAPLIEWERQIAVDAYRIRRLIARWLDEGALQPA